MLCWGVMEFKIQVQNLEKELELKEGESGDIKKDHLLLLIVGQEGVF